MESFINTFNGGMDSDTSPRATAPNKYLIGNDVTLTSLGSYTGLKPRIGDSTITNIYDNSTFSVSEDFNDVDFSNVINCQGAQSCIIVDSGVKKKGLVLFSSRSTAINIVGNEAVDSSGISVFEVHFVTLNDDNSFESKNLVYSKERPSSDGYLTSSVDIELSGDGDLDILYITNQVDVPMRIKCTLDEFHSGSVFSDEETSLIKYSPAYINDVRVSSGGNLPCGTYQFCVRLINSTNGIRSKWSLISNPVPIFNDLDKEDFPNSEVPSSGVGEISNKKIEVDVETDSESSSDYDYYQLAVIKGVEGSGIAKLGAFVLNPELGTSVTYEYNGDSTENSITIDDIVIDEAQIENINTLNIKNNFLIGGNIKYFELSYDNGDISFTNASNDEVTIPVTTTIIGKGDLIGNQESSYSVNGINDLFYFRDEVYRFGISYHDKYGNWSEPVSFDFSSIGNNSADSGCVDWKFPDLYNTPITGANDEEITGLGLTINNISNHPSWAKGFAILRVKRIKDIQAQTPVIPSMYVQPMDSDVVYPQLGFTELPEAQPPSSSLGTYMPKNLTHPRAKHCVRGNIHCQWYFDYDEDIPFQDPFGGAGADTASSHGACEYIHVVFPPNNIYNNALNYYEPYIHKPSDTLDVVDIQKLEYVNVEFAPNVEENATHDNVNSAADLSYSVDILSNYTRDGSGNGRVTDLSYIEADNQILEYLDITEGQDKGIFTSSIPKSRVSTFGDYSGLVAEGLNEGTPPNNQRMGVIITSKPLQDVNYQLGYDPTTEENSHNSGTPGIDIANSLNKSDLKDTYIPIANIRRGLSDFRYGAINDSHEFIYTGTYVRLSESDISGNIPKTVSIRGGDCSYDMHNFKLCDSHYSIPDNNNHTGTFFGTPGKDLLNEKYSVQYGNSFVNTDSSDNNLEIGRPVPIEAFSQQIGVLLESEIRAKFSDRSYGQKFKLVGNNSMQTAGSSADARTPLLYQYNLDLSLPNSNKVFTSVNDLDDDNSIFRSRLIYSDQRIYQSSELGFDTFRVGNTYDMDESRGAITILVNSIDNLFSIQSRGVSYIPVQGNIIESTDSSSLAVRSADIIGIPQYLNTVYGTEYFRGVAQCPDGFYFSDASNNKVLKVSNSSLSEVSSLGMNSYFEDKLDTYSNAERKLFSVYDVKNKEYLLFSGETFEGVNDSWGIVFSEKSNSWVSLLSTSNRYNILSGCYGFGSLFMFGKFGKASVDLSRLGDGNNLNYLGVDQEPYIDLYVNPNVGVPKIFDVFDVDSDYKLKSITAETFDTNSNLSQYFNANILSGSQREGTYRVPLPRDDSNKARLRGTYSKVRLLFHNESDYDLNRRPELFSLRSNYRISERRY